MWLTAGVGDVNQLPISKSNHFKTHLPVFLPKVFTPFAKLRCFRLFEYKKWKVNSLKID